MRTLHQVQRRSGNSIWDVLGADGMRHIVPELHGLVNRLMMAFACQPKIFLVALIRRKRMYDIVHA